MTFDFLSWPSLAAPAPLARSPRPRSAKLRCLGVAKAGRCAQHDRPPKVGRFADEMSHRMPRTPVFGLALLSHVSDPSLSSWTERLVSEHPSTYGPQRNS